MIVKQAATFVLKKRIILALAVIMQEQEMQLYGKRFTTVLRRIRDWFYVRKLSSDS